MKLLQGKDIGKKPVGIASCSACGNTFALFVADLRIVRAFGHDMARGVDTEEDSLNWKCESCDREQTFCGPETVLQDVRTWKRVQDKRGADDANLETAAPGAKASK